MPMMVDEIPVEHRELIRDLFTAHDSAEYLAAWEAIEDVGREAEQAAAETGAPAGRSRAGGDRRDNKAELIPMLDDDDWFVGDEAALERRNRLQAQRTGQAPVTVPEPAPEPKTFTEEVLEDGWISIDDLHSEND